jgi:hypothetical protein
MAQKQIDEKVLQWLMENKTDIIANDKVKRKAFTNLWTKLCEVRYAPLEPGDEDTRSQKMMPILENYKDKFQSDFYLDMCHKLQETHVAEQKTKAVYEITYLHCYLEPTPFNVNHFSIQSEEITQTVILPQDQVKELETTLKRKRVADLEDDTYDIGKYMSDDRERTFVVTTSELRDSYSEAVPFESRPLNKILRVRKWGEG